MSSEYIKLSGSEKITGQKFFLQSELETIMLSKSLKSYKAHRKEEFILKVALVTKIGETLNELQVLEKMLPKTHLEKDESEKISFKKDKEPKDLSLDQEIALIREKLSKLRE